MTVHPKLIALSLSMVGGIAIAAILILVMSSGTVSAQQVLTDAQAKTSSAKPIGSLWSFGRRRRLRETHRGMRLEPML